VFPKDFFSNDNTDSNLTPADEAESMLSPRIPEYSGYNANKRFSEPSISSIRMSGRELGDTIKPSWRYNQDR